MDTNPLVHQLIEYRWFILVPLSIWESTVVAFVAGLLAAAGYFDIYALLAYFFARDIVIDLAYYGLGHWGGHTRWATRMLARLHITEAQLDSVRELWDKQPARTMFIGKFSYGIASAFIMVAGMVRMNMRKFLTYGALAAVVQYGLYVGAGYFFGASFGGNIIGIVNNLQYVVLGASILLIGYYYFTHRMRARMLKNDEELGGPSA